jgi:8-oxo-dGTP pyrophosphatase MutT (NUDIX family)
MKQIEKVAAIITNDGGNNILCVKKKGLAPWISPGGKIDPGESHQQCLRRELREELDATLGFTLPDLDAEKPFMTCKGIAEGLPDTFLTIHFYHVYLVNMYTMTPCNEIEYYTWAPIKLHARLPLAWTLKNEVLPELCRTTPILGS